MFNSGDRLERIRDFVKCQKTINTVQRQMGSNTNYTDLVYSDIEWACREIEELRNEIARVNTYIENYNSVISIKKNKSKIL